MPESVEMVFGPRGEWSRRRLALQLRQPVRRRAPRRRHGRRRAEEGSEPPGDGRLEGGRHRSRRDLPRIARARHGARARRARGEEGRSDREGVREDRRPADLRRRQERPRRLGRRPVPAGRGQGRGGCVRAPDRVRRRGRSPRSRERDRQGRDLGAGRAGRRGRDRAARHAARRRAVVRAHRRLGRSPSGPPPRPVGDAVRPLRQAASRHRAAARSHAEQPPRRACAS